jgi:chromosome segregation ATPase
MPGRGIYDTVKQAIQDIVAPQLQELKGDIAGFRGEIKGEITGLRAEITGLRAEVRQIEKRMEDGFASIRNEMSVRFAALDEKFSQRLDHTNQRLDDALEIRERLAALEARVAAQS